MNSTEVNPDGFFQVRSLDFVNCSEDPTLVQLLLLAVASNLEGLEMHHARQEHVEALGVMLLLRRLSVAFSRSVIVPVGATCL